MLEVDWRFKVSVRLVGWGKATKLLSICTMLGLLVRKNHYSGVQSTVEDQFQIYCAQFEIQINCLPLCKTFRRDGSGYQNRWIFGKVPNGLPTIWPSYLLAYMQPYMVPPTFKGFVSMIEKLQYNFPKNEGGRAEGRLEFSENSSDLVALPVSHKRNVWDAIYRSCLVEPF